MGLISTLYVGTRALSASQLGINVAGQNISNADVEGYSRKRLNLTPDYRYDPQFGQMGTGVAVTNILRMRDAQIDQQIRRQNREVGYYEEINYAMTRVENIFIEPGDTGLLTYIDRFFDSWHNLANNPQDISSRTLVRTSAEMLCHVFQNLGSELRDLRASINDRIVSTVSRVNQLAEEIYNTNREIGSVEIGTQKANDSRDRRDQLLKELSKLIDINTIENELGQITVTTAGNLLVSPVDFRTLETTTATNRTADGASVAAIGIRFSDSKRAYSPLGGSLRGLFEARDTIIPEYQKTLDTLALSLVEQVNRVHRDGFNLFGYTGIDFFNPGATGASDIAISASIRSDIQNIAAAQAGAGMYASRNTFSGATPLSFPAQPQLLSRTGTVPPAPTDTARNVVQGSVVVTALAAGTQTVLREGIDYHIDYLNGTIQLLNGSHNGADFTVDFQYTTASYRGPGDNANAVAIARLREALTMQPDPVGNATNTFAQYYGAFIGQLGLNRNAVESNLQTRNFLVEQYETHQEAISGVSLDEEMADIIKYQHTYHAAARLISITSQMLDILMNM